VFCQSQGERLAREATTDDENVKLVHGSRGRVSIVGFSDYITLLLSDIS
jgi:hypothetical protein